MPAAIADAELLELLLGYVIKRRDVKPQARDILKQAGHLGNIFEGGIVSIKGVNGVGEETELFFELLKEFIDRSLYRKIEKKPLDLSNLECVYTYLKSRIADSSQEVLAVLLLDAKNRLIDNKLLKQGKVGEIAINIRDVIAFSLERNAYGVIIAHNHPTGDVKPSREDVLSTKELFKALAYAGVALLDHIIVAPTGYYSMRNSGELDKISEEV
jgi:DNA repair protein RadC